MITSEHPPDDEAIRLLNGMDCYSHYFEMWRPDVERNDKGRLTESRGCKECGHVQVRPCHLRKR